MQFQLRDNGRVGFLMIGSTSFTVDSPGPVEINVEALPPAEKCQLLYECRRGALACSDPKSLVKICEKLVPAARSYSTPSERPINPAKTPNLEDEREKIKEDLKGLKSMLRGSIGSIKKKATSLPIGRVRKLLELESENKDRKSLKAFLEAILTKHGKDVVDSVGVNDIGTMITAVGVGQIGSSQVSDVVESEVEQVVLNPAED